MTMPFICRLMVLLSSWLFACQPALPVKPNVWVYTDPSNPQDRRQGGHPQNDPDDIVSLASLLLSANRFEIKGIVVSSTNRKGLGDPMPFVEEVFVSAYENDRPGMEKVLGGFQEKIPFLRSSLTLDSLPLAFDSGNDYTDLSQLGSVAALVSLAQKEAVYVLSWGPLTESAMAVKHCLSTGKHKALQNMVFLSHWTKSSVAQGSPETPFAVANCRDDQAACDYMHQIALQEADVRFVELGCVGQNGIVNGSVDYPNLAAFNQSRLGQIFLRAKFYFGKPDFSDAATHWLLTEGFGPGLDAYPQDGSLSLVQEKQFVEAFLLRGQTIMADLQKRAEAGGQSGQPFSEKYLAQYFTYAYFRNEHYSLYLPYPADYELTDQGGQTLLQGSLPEGNHRLEVPLAARPPFSVRLTYANSELTMVIP